ncbi:MAG TPA: patatin-like phospholipase family protein [Steroidobacteraceae bacterium]|nr:patatin-like phospholipase family protein [Steroidobacteraceae bacterium]
MPQPYDAFLRTLSRWSMLLWLVPALAGAQADNPTDSTAPPEQLALAAADASVPPPSLPQVVGRPRIGLVLSGGGARGAAHIGVLKVLEELRVPIDAIAGTSMGAIVGGLYASGLSAREIEEAFRSINWQDAFTDRTARQEMNFRRKQDDQTFLVRFPLGLKDGEFILPKGFIQGQKLTQTLRGLTFHVGAVGSFDELPIPYRAVATDLETGKAVVLDHGDLATAMRASMSAPGVFSPVTLDDRMLIDGGIAQNLPIDVARSMQVDVLIVVDVSFPLLPRDELQTALEVSNQALAIMVRREAERQLATLAAHDIVIEPPLGQTSSVDFRRVNDSTRLGELAARELEPRLAALALDAPAYAQHVEQRRRRDVQPPRIDFVRAEERSSRYEKTIEAAFSPFVGQPLDLERLEDSIQQVYGLDYFETVDYRVVREGDLSGLEIAARRKSWGPNYVRFGLNLQDDFEGNNSFNAAARFIVTEINQLGGEWLTDLQAGENPLFFTEFYQPLNYGSRYFLSPQIEFQIRNFQVLEDQQRIAEYRVRAGQVGLDFGKEFGNWGELRTGLRRGEGRTRLRIGDPSLPEERFDIGEMFARFSYDKLDNVNFPRSGGTFALQWNAPRESLGADASTDLLTLDWLVARSWGKHTVLGWVSGGSTVDGEAAVQDFYTLGGFLQLSGLREDSLAGPHFGIARMVYYRQIGRPGPGFLNVAAYLGASLEVGNVWATREEASFESARKDGSLFLGLDTFFGPLYLAAGMDDEGDTAFYLFLGRPF